MNILMASPEVVPFAKTGGLADVAGSIPKHIEELGHNIYIIMPYYKKVYDAGFKLKLTGKSVTVPLGDETKVGNIWRGKLPNSNVPIFFIENNEFFHREQLYGTPEGDYEDNSKRFIFFSRACLEAIKELKLNIDVIHCHDWQASLIPAYIKTLYADDKQIKHIGSLLTIHNIAYQGIFWHWDMKLTGFDWSMFNWKELEYYGKINFLKGGLVYADILNTVSPKYAKEIQTSEYGYGMEGVLQERDNDLYGIINGIDYSVWDPSIDEHIPAKFSPKSLAGKAKCKAALQNELGLPTSPDVPMLGIISRLADQKGFDLIAEIIDQLMLENIQLVVLGTGDEKYHEILRKIGAKYKDKASINIAFSNPLAHKIEAASDMFLMPSRYEPCGLNQLYSLKYGSVPVVRRTGGLADTIIDCTEESMQDKTATGFVFEEYTPQTFFACIKRALDFFGDTKKWQRLMKNGMEQDWSWGASAKKYVELYKKAKK